MRQLGFHDGTVRGLKDWKAESNYIQMNPVKARFCERPGVLVMDPNLDVASVAKALIAASTTQRLERLPPNELHRGAVELGGARRATSVGPEGPSPGGSTAIGAVSEAIGQVAAVQSQRPKRMPPEEKTE
jgi:hypothetical protein